MQLLVRLKLLRSMSIAWISHHRPRSNHHWVCPNRVMRPSQFHKLRSAYDGLAPMSTLRDDFRSFLLRVADNDLRANDWGDFATCQHADKEIESLRRRLMVDSLSFSDWQVGWVPRRLQDLARGLAEYLREYPAESATYWPEWSRLADDGTLILKVTWSDSETLSTGCAEIPPSHHDYAFWRWVLDDPERRRGLKRGPDIAALRQEYEGGH